MNTSFEVGIVIDPWDTDIIPMFKGLIFHQMCIDKLRHIRAHTHTVIKCRVLQQKYEQGIVIA